jgi:hypothetical protein
MIALALVLLAAQASEPSREERVLELLQRIRPRANGFYALARFEVRTTPLGSGALGFPRYGVLCSGLDEGTIDGARARALARELFAIYGLEVVPDLPLGGEGGLALIDGVAYPAKLGFELRGCSVRATGAQALREHADAELDAGELEWLGSQGFRLHVADVTEYRRIAGDEFSPTLAWLAGLARFLNEHTDGEDVELGGLLFEREGTWAWPADAAAVAVAGAHVTDRGGDWLELTVERGCTIAFASTAAGWGPPETEAFLRPPAEPAPLQGSTRGAPSVILLDVVVDPLPSAAPGTEPEVRLRVRQRDRVRESPSFAVFLTRDFDLAEPFEVELELAPGRYLVQGPARLGAARLDVPREGAPAPR